MTIKNYVRPSFHVGVEDIGISACNDSDFMRVVF